jgi:Flp pilus assembly protein TadG
MVQHKSPRKNRQIAQSMVEFALIFPLLVVILYGILEFGRLMFIYISVINSSREAARYGSSVGNPGSYRYVNCNGMIDAARRSAILTTILPEDVTITYDRDLGNTVLFGGAECGDTAIEPSQIKLGDRVNVQVTLTYTPLMPVNWASFDITAHSARTIIKAVEVAGENVGELGTPRPYFDNVGPFDYPENHNGTAEGASFSVNVDVLLDNSPTEEVVVPLLLSGTASNGQDYTLSALSVTFPAGDTIESVSLTIFNDFLDEEDIQNVVITLGAPTNGLPCTYNCVYTANILDNDLPPDIFFETLASSSAEEAGAVGIVVMLSTISEREITFSYGAIGGSATEGVDYVVPPMPTTIAPLTLAVPTALVLEDDSIYEDDETAILRLTSATNATIISPGDLHEVTIVNTDPMPIVSFDLDRSVGTEDVGVVRLALRLDRISAKAVEVNLRIDTIADSATLNVDYVMVNGLNYTIPAGQREAEVEITIRADTELEEDEFVSLVINSAIDAEIGDPSTHLLTIRETAELPVVQFTRTAKSVDEGLATMTARIFINNAWNEDISISFSKTGTAADGADYTGVTPSPVVLRAGTVSVDILIPVLEDLRDEVDETVILTITSAATATVGTQNPFVLTILDDDEAPVISFVSANTTVEEGVGLRTVEVVLSTPSEKTVQAPFTVGGSAQPNDDYLLLTPTPLVFAPGTTSQTIQVEIYDDDIYTGARDILLTLTTPTNATLGAPSQHTINIIENEVCPTLSGWTLSDKIAFTTISLPVDAPIISLVSMTVTQQSGQAFREAEMGANNTIWQGNAGGTTVTITDFKNGSSLTISGATGGRVLKLTFKNNITLPGSYSVSLTWSNGCTVRKP